MAEDQRIRCSVGGMQAAPCRRSRWSRSSSGSSSSVSTRPCGDSGAMHRSSPRGPLV